jgi:glycosyltransferase involved in cell wall biosynthesis
MQAAPDVVVLVPTYNSATTIEETLASIQEQGDDLRRIRRVIITDDGSTDNTLDLARRCWRVDTSLEVFEAPRNRGEYTNVNEAVARLGPDICWFCIMHSDNMAKKGWVAALTNQIKVAPADVGSICTSWDDLYLDGRLVPGENALSGEVRTVPSIRESIYHTLRKGCWWHNSTAAIRIEAFRRVGGMPAGQGLRQKGDWDFLLRLLAGGWAVQYIPRSLMIYRENPQSVSGANFLHHGDITESIAIVQRYCAGCPRKVLFAIHARQLGFLLRRCGSSLRKGMFKRFTSALRAMGFVIQGFFVSLANSRRPSKDR